MSIGFGKGEFGRKRELPVRFLPGRSRMVQGHARKDADGAPRANAAAMQARDTRPPENVPVQDKNIGFLR